MTKITEFREAYKPWEFPKYFDYYQKAVSSIWRVEEVNFHSDIYDWDRATQTERDIIGGILRGFTQLETFIGDYWSDNVAHLFPKHEIVAACRAFAFFETVHSRAYNHLSDTLGIDEYEAFLGDPIAQTKLNYFLTQLPPKVSLAVFSGAGEGVSLFSSFAVLLGFSLSGRFKGLSQVISWSALDEQSHSDMGIDLFLDYVAEDGLTDQDKSEIFMGFDQVIANEFAFIDNIFQERELEFISAKSLQNYILHRANERLRRLGLIKKDKYAFNRYQSNKVKEWFEPLTKGQSSTDFFSMAKDGGNYISKPTQQLMNVNLKELNLSL